MTCTSYCFLKLKLNVLHYFTVCNILYKIMSVVEIELDRFVSIDINTLIRKFVWYESDAQIFKLAFKLFYAGENYYKWVLEAERIVGRAIQDNNLDVMWVCESIIDRKLTGNFIYDRFINDFRMRNAVTCMYENAKAIEKKNFYKGFIVMEWYHLNESRFTEKKYIEPPSSRNNYLFRGLIECNRVIVPCCQTTILNACDRKCTKYNYVFSKEKQDYEEATFGWSNYKNMTNLKQVKDIKLKFKEMEKKVKEYIKKYKVSCAGTEKVIDEDKIKFEYGVVTYMNNKKCI